jgi:hypothetical protein
VPLGNPTELDARGLGRLQGQATLPQPLAQRLLNPSGSRPPLKAHHHVIAVPHQRGFTLSPGLDHALNPQVEPVVQVHMTQQHAARPPWRCSLGVRVNLPVFQQARFAPASSQADQARIADSVFDT